MRADRCYTSRPFTVAACVACAPEVADAVLPRLRQVVRNCPHGVLVLTQCPIGKITCATTGSDRGVILLLQPRTVHRVPVASARWVGPVRTDAEIEAVCDWISSGAWDRAALPLDLRADINLAKESRMN